MTEKSLEALMNEAAARLEAEAAARAADHTRDPKSFGYAYRHGSLDVWPGCGREGKCKPCGKLCRSADGGVRCAQWENHGCPSAATQARHAHHDMGQWGCRVCGKRRGWISLRTKTWYETRRKAVIIGGEDADRLVRAPSKVSMP